MTLQARMSEGDQRWYDPSRDLAHCFDIALAEVNDRIQKRRWPELAEVCDRLGVTDNDLGQAVKALNIFVASAVDVRQDTLYACLDRSNWFKTPPGAQIAVSALLGTVAMGLFFAGARHATINGVGPCDTLQYLHQIAHEIAEIMALSRWGRFRRRIFTRCRRIWAAIRGG